MKIQVIRIHFEILIKGIKWNIHQIWRRIIGYNGRVKTCRYTKYVTKSDPNRGVFTSSLRK